MEFIEKLKGFLLKPVKSFKAEAKTKVGEATRYLLIGSVILGVLNGIILAFGLSTFTPFATSAVAVIIFSIILHLIGVPLGLMLSGLWLHLWVYALGGREGIGNTFKIVFYAYSPVYVLGWIPIIKYLAQIWGLVLEVIGLTKLQKFSKWRAIGAVVATIIIPLIILIILIISIAGPEFLTAIGQLGSTS